MSLFFCPNLISQIGIHIPGLGGSQSCRDCSSTVGRHLAVRVRGEWLCSETAGGTSQPLAAADPTLDLEWWAAQLFYWSCIRKLAMVQFSTVWCVKVSDVEMFKMFRLFLIISFWFPTLRAIPALAGLGCLESRSWDWSQRGAQIDGWSLKSWFKEMVTWRNNRVIWCHIVIWCHMYIYGHLCAYIITYIYI